jgi:hypothetical protein
MPAAQFGCCGGEFVGVMVGGAGQAHPRLTRTFGDLAACVCGEQEQLWPHSAFCCLGQDAGPVAVERLLEREPDQPRA